MDAQTKQCQNCQNSFIIAPEDFEFYAKIAVPPPTFCPQCRALRRMAWRNERTLYRRQDAFGKDVLSIYAPERTMTVYERDYWWSDAWDPLASGRPYDFTVPFFKQFRELLAAAPLPNVFTNNAVRSPYSNHCGYLKNCYLVFASWECENVFYGEKLIQAKDSLDSYGCRDIELCYETVDCEKSNRLVFSRDCNSCFDSAFLYDCRNCSHCFGCTGLRNKEYYIFNKPYSKEAYAARMKELDIGSYTNLKSAATEFSELCLQYPRRFAHLSKTVNVVGNHCRNMKNCYACFDLFDIEQCKYITHGGLGMKDSYDAYGAGAQCELLYEGIDTGANGLKELFSIVVYGCNNSTYCFNCESCTNVFGCVGLRNKQYCILNKQYTKEEYEALTARIIRHMNDVPYIDAKGRIYKYGEFFPAPLSPFAYNETIAQEYFPLTKEEATLQGYRWREPDPKQYRITVAATMLPDSISDTKNDIGNEVIGCAHEENCQHQCTSAFRITPEELALYNIMGVALPRACPNCRHYARLAQRTPLKLWRRQCMCTKMNHHHDVQCPNKFETSYAPEGPEIVYCEACYNAEIA